MRDYAFDARGNESGSVAPTIVGDHNERVTDYSAVVVQAAGFCYKAPQGAYSVGYEDECSPTLRAGQTPAGMYCFDETQITCPTNRSAVKANAPCHTLSAQSHSPVCCYPEIANTLTVRHDISCDLIKWIVRRLMPIECERLQGYPDNWTVLPKKQRWSDGEYELFLEVWTLNKQFKGQTVKRAPKREQLLRWYNKLCNDGSRYRALGNSIAIPCALRVVEGITNYREQKRPNPKKEVNNNEPKPTKRNFGKPQKMAGNAG